MKIGLAIAIIVFALLLLGMISRAEAAHCPRGQWYRVHLHVCVAKRSHVARAVDRAPARSSRRHAPYRRRREPDNPTIIILPEISPTACRPSNDFFWSISR